MFWPLPQICTFKLTALQKIFRRSRLYRNIAEIILQQNNARSRASLKTQEKITNFGWTVLPHLLYITYFIPSDFHPFGTLGNVIRKKCWRVISLMEKWRSEKWREYKIHTGTRKCKCSFYVWRKTDEDNGDYEKSKLLAIKEMLSKTFYATFVPKKKKKTEIRLVKFYSKFLCFTDVSYFFSRYDPAYLDDSYLWRINLWVKQHFYFTPANSL